MINLRKRLGGLGYLKITSFTNYKYEIIQSALLQNYLTDSFKSDYAGYTSRLNF